MGLGPNCSSLSCEWKVGKSGNLEFRLYFQQILGKRKEKRDGRGEREKDIQREKESKLGKQEHTSEQGGGLLWEITE